MALSFCVMIVTKLWYCNHILNVIFNDLNEVDEIRNTAATIKEIFHFFRKSILHRKIVPNALLLDETHWSVKYKSIRIFSENFLVIAKALDELLKSTANSKTKVKVYQLQFLLLYCTYWPVIPLNLNQYTISFNRVDINLKTVSNHIIKLVDILQLYRNNFLPEFSEIFAKT